MLPTAPPSNVYGAATGLAACKSTVSPQPPAQVTLERSGELTVKNTGLCLRAGGFLQVFSKRIEVASATGGGKIAVLVLSNAGAPHSVAIDLKGDLGVASGVASVRDIYSRAELGEVEGTLTTDQIGPRDSRFFIVTPLGQGR